MNGEERTPEKNLYIALLHHPVYDKNGQVVTTCVTNLDLHDIARVSKTYDVNRFFVVQPVASQEALMQRIIHHWTEGFGAQYNATRKSAFETMAYCHSLGQAVDQIRNEWQGREPTLVVTAASRFRRTIGFTELRRRVHEDKDPYLLLFGTGWGLTEDVVREADYVLEPIRGTGDYNHLSVRSAVSIVVDRLMGEREDAS